MVRLFRRNIASFVEGIRAMFTSEKELPPCGPYRSQARGGVGPRMRLLYGSLSYLLAVIAGAVLGGCAFGLVLELGSPASVGFAWIGAVGSAGMMMAMGFLAEKALHGSAKYWYERCISAERDALKMHKKLQRPCGVCMEVNDG